jgi:hypothetical protein
MKSAINAFLVSLVAFFVPIQGVLLLVGFSILLDTVFGVYSSRKQGKKITSKILSWGIVSKMISYEAVILLIYAIEVLLLNDIIKSVVSVELIVTKLAALTLVSIEAFSIDESVRAFNNDKGVAFYFGRLIKLGKSVKGIQDGFKKNTPSSDEV